MIERILIEISWRIPKSLCYWIFIRVATSGKDGKAFPGNPGDRLCSEAGTDWFNKWMAK